MRVGWNARKCLRYSQVSAMKYLSPERSVDRPPKFETALPAITEAGSSVFFTSVPTSAVVVVLP